MLSIECNGSVTVVRLAHGKVNALDVELLHHLSDELDRRASDDGAGVVLTGNGRVFSAGVDLVRVREGGADYLAALIPALTRAFRTVFTFPRPIVAAIDGAAIAGGCVLAAACDHRLAAGGAAPIGVSELAVGVPFPVAALEVLRHATGPLADELVLRARQVDAQTARQLGLVHEVVPAVSLLERAVAVAAELASLSPAAFAMAKEQLRRPTVERMTLDAGHDRDVTALWGAPETGMRIAAQLARLGGRDEDR